MWDVLIWILWTGSFRKGEIIPPCFGWGQPKSFLRHSGSTFIFVCIYISMFSNSFLMIQSCWDWVLGLSHLQQFCPRPSILVVCHWYPSCWQSKLHNFTFNGFDADDKQERGAEQFDIEVVNVGDDKPYIQMVFSHLTCDRLSQFSHWFTILLSAYLWKETHN